MESCILAWVTGLIWSEIKQLWDVGLREYISDMWNVVDFITNSLYVATIGLRTVAYFDVSRICFGGAVMNFSVAMNRKFDQRLNLNQILNLDRIQMPE